MFVEQAPPFLMNNIINGAFEYKEKKSFCRLNMENILMIDVWFLEINAVFFSVKSFEGSSSGDNNHLTELRASRFDFLFDSPTNNAWNLYY